MGHLRGTQGQQDSEVFLEIVKDGLDGFMWIEEV